MHRKKEKNTTKPDSDSKGIRYNSPSVIVISFLISVLLFGISMRQVALDRDFYYKEFIELGVHSVVPGADNYGQNIIDFLAGKSALDPIFNSAEKNHMDDVKRLFSRIDYVIQFCAVLSILMSAGIFARAKEKKDAGLAIGALYSVSICTAAIVLISCAVIAIIPLTGSFSSTFDSFHATFFAEGSWLFDPAESTLINLFPEQFFADAFSSTLWRYLRAGFFLVILTALLKVADSRIKRMKGIISKAAR